MFPIPIDGRPLSVLIADERADGAESLADLLGVFGHEVTVAHSGPAALAAAARSPPDVLIVEPRLPGLDGWEVARRLQASGHPLLCIAVSTLGRPEDRMQSEAAGILIHLLKPADPELLVELLACFSLTRAAQLEHA
jgi:CheY-like chemotaxis protein